MSKIKIIEKYVKEIISQQPGHGFDHVDRVRHWALKIAKAEKYPDLVKIEAAALLHDIGLPYVRKRLNHGQAGARVSKEFLSKNKLFSPAEIKEICHAVKYHCKKDEGQGELLAILKDADMLDLFGLIGIVRAYQDHSQEQPFIKDNVKGDTWGFTNHQFDHRIQNNLPFGDAVTDLINFLISCQGNLTTNFAKQKAKKLVQQQKNFLIALEKEVKMCYH